MAAISGNVIELMDHVEVDLASGDYAAASEGLIQIATAIFELDTFAPEVAVDDWSAVLLHWVQGRNLADLPGDRVATAQFIESDLVYDWFGAWRPHGSSRWPKAMPSRRH